MNALVKASPGTKVTLHHKTDGRALKATFLGYLSGSFRAKFQVLLGDEVPSVVSYTQKALANYDIEIHDSSS